MADDQAPAQEQPTTDHRTGTREWSDVSINCCLGCANGCLYCYARARARQYGRLKLGGDWRGERCKSVDEVRKDPQYRRHYAGVVMMPTTHDLTAGTADTVLDVLRMLLAAGNKVLLVTKADPRLADRVASVWYDACRHGALGEKGGALEIRVSIGCLDERIAHAWEPFAPRPADRTAALRFWHDQGIATSVSAEPLLDPPTAVELVERVAPWVSGPIWIGKMNEPSARLKWFWNECTDGDRRQRIRGLLETLEFWQSDARVMSVVDALGRCPSAGRIAWKDSYREVIERITPP
jgi:hypothetical protein